VAGVTDLRRGFTGLSAMVQTTLEQDPFSGHVFVFRGRRGDLVKALWWDGDGLCLFSEAIGARALHLAAGHERQRGAESRAVIDASGRHRLAACGA
jgi:transposase